VEKITIMRRVIALIYWIFKTDKKQTTPYFSTGLIVVALIVLPFFFFVFLFDIPISFLHLIDLSNRKLKNWVNTFLWVTPLLFLFFLFNKRSTLNKYRFSDLEIKKGRRKLILGLIILIGLLALSAFRLVIKYR
jgi:hypothetical protein